MQEQIIVVMLCLVDREKKIYKTHSRGKHRQLSVVRLIAMLYVSISAWSVVDMSEEKDWKKQNRHCSRQSLLLHDEEAVVTSMPSI